MKKNLKLNENCKNLEDKLNELIKIRNSIINTNNEYKKGIFNYDFYKIKIQI